MGVETKQWALNSLYFVLNYEPGFTNLYFLEFALNFVHVLCFPSNLQQREFWFFDWQSQLKDEVLQIDNPNYVCAYKTWGPFDVVHKAKQLRVLLVYLDVYAFVVLFYRENCWKLRKRLRLQHSFFLIEALHAKGVKSKRALRQSVIP